ncbi:hypothetical protein [Ramlibacter sp. AN1133]|uniref:hypothetical protein n=1 Tax=Ramlibacter sp. AN1133 TaxID=3133429 RepID=UPI0030BEB8F3
MKNIEIVGSEDNAASELFAATEEEFAVFFRPGENIVFLERLAQHVPKVQLYATLARVLARPVVPGPGIATHGVLFYEKRPGEGSLL